MNATFPFFSPLSFERQESFQALPERTTIPLVLRKPAKTFRIVPDHFFENPVPSTDFRGGAFHAGEFPGSKNGLHGSVSLKNARALHRCLASVYYYTGKGVDNKKKKMMIVVCCH
jgi:hypothetical protein